MYKQQSKFFKRLMIFDSSVASELISPSLPNPDQKKKRKKVKWRSKDKRFAILAKPLNIIRISENVVKRIKE